MKSEILGIRRYQKYFNINKMLKNLQAIHLTVILVLDMGYQFILVHELELELVTLNRKQFFSSLIFYSCSERRKLRDT